MNGETYTSYTSTNLEFDTNYLRYVFSSMTQPSKVVQIEMNTLKKEVLKEQIIQGNFDSNNYTSKRIWVDSEMVRKYCFNFT